MLLASFPWSFARLVRSVCALLGAGGLALAPAWAQSPSAADGFDPNVDGNVNAVLTQPDGKIVIGGQFSSVGGAARGNIARLNPDGTVDSAFNPGADGPVRALLLQRGIKFKGQN